METYFPSDPYRQGMVSNSAILLNFSAFVNGKEGFRSVVRLVDKK